MRILKTFLVVQLVIGSALLILELFSSGQPNTEFVNSRDGLTTWINKDFIRYWWEIDYSKLNRFAETPGEFCNSEKKWAPLIKGGSHRKWYGYVINVKTYDKNSFNVLSVSGNKLPSKE